MYSSLREILMRVLAVFAFFIVVTFALGQACSREDCVAQKQQHISGNALIQMKHAVAFEQTKHAFLTEEGGTQQTTCQPTCATNQRPWQKKCNWKNCKGCNDCLTCPQSCAKIKKPWTEKCSWKNCKRCNDCSTCLQSCVNFKKSWTEKCSWKICKGCSDCAKSQPTTPAPTQARTKCQQCLSEGYDYCISKNMCTERASHGCAGPDDHITGDAAFAAKGHLAECPQAETPPVTDETDGGDEGGSDGGIGGTYGRVVTIGDSMFSTTKKAYVDTLGALLSTPVVVNARSGAPMEAIAKQAACSSDDECEWCVMNDAPAAACGSSKWMDAFQNILTRELGAQRKVIIVGYPTFLEIEKDVSQYNKIMDIYADAASDHEHVWFVDPRQNPIWQTSLDMYAGDKKHPHPQKGGEVFANEVAKIIQENSPSPPTARTTT